MPSSGAASASMMSSPGVCIGERALIRLEESMQIMKYYEIVNYKPVVSQLNLNCCGVIKLICG